MKRMIREAGDREIALLDLDLWMRVEHWPRGQWTPEGAMSLPAISLTVNAD